jgi:hypothetical protein
MSDTKFAPAMFELLGKAMDEVAREFGAMDLDDPKRGPLLKELSALTQLRFWLKSLKSEPNRLLAQPMEKLARELVALKVRDRRRVQIIAEIMHWSHSLQEH